MSELNQPQYYAARERQQREYAARAHKPDIVSFHERLAEHYARLFVEAQGLVPDRGI